MTKRSLLCLLATCALAAQACTSSTTDGTGVLTVRLTDAPFPVPEVERLDVHVVRIDARQAQPTEAEAEDDEDMGGWTTIASPNATIDLLSLGNGNTVNLGETTLPTGNYDGFRLIIDLAQSSVTLKNGDPI